MMQDAKGGPATGGQPGIEQTDRDSTAREGAALDRRYGAIGISAVAAAVRYQGGAKNPAYAPAPTGWRDRLADVAA